MAKFIDANFQINLSFTYRFEFPDDMSEEAIKQALDDFVYLSKWGDLEDEIGMAGTPPFDINFSEVDPDDDDKDADFLYRTQFQRLC